MAISANSFRQTRLFGRRPRWPRFLRTAAVAMLFFLPFVATPVHAAITSIEPVTWNIVGLDSNSPATGPNRFPVGARVCSSTAETDYPVYFVWESANAWINLTSRAPLPDDMVEIDIPAGGCADAYFEVTVTRTAAAYTTARGYYIEAGGLQTPRPRELYVEYLISQARNAIVDLKFGDSPFSLTSVPAGGSFSLVKGQTYWIRMDSYTATQGYEQLETFSTLPNTIFQVKSVETTYTADTTTNVSSPNDKLYGDACYWENDPASPNYLACNGEGKIGGTISVLYEVEIIDVLGGAQPINSLIYDRSGASYHYNSDYDSGGRNVYLIDPASLTIGKRFTPGTVASGGTSTLTITIGNPNAAAVSGVTVIDDFLSDVVFTGTGSGAMTVAATPNLTTTCSDSTPTITGGNTGISLVDATVPAGGCTIKVDVTTDIEGSYANTAHLAVAGTAKQATATLIVDDSAIPSPQPPSACPGQEVTLASWNFDNLTTGQTIPVPSPFPGGTPTNYSTKASNVAYAAASFYLTGGTGGNLVSNTYSYTGSAPNSWRGIGWWTVSPALPAVTDTRFQFDVDTSNYGGVFIEFYARYNANGNWQGNAAGNRVRVWRNGQVQLSTGTPNNGTDDTGLSTTWKQYYRSPATDFPDDTTFAVQGFYAKDGDVGAVFLDNVAIKGCAVPAVPPSPPTITKAFSPATVAVNATSILTFTVTNPNAGSALSGVAFDDTLPDGLTVTSGTASVCNGTLTRTAPNQISFTSPDAPTVVLAASASCNIPVTVTAISAGSHENISGYVSARESGANTTATGTAKATLTALLPPTIDKNFTPSSIYTSATAYNKVSTLTFTIVNPNTSAISSVAFSDDFPGSAPNDVVVANPSGATTSGCGTPIFAPVAGSGSITFSGGSIAAGGTCTVTVDVVSATAGYYTNTSGAVTHTINAVAWGSDTATSSLLVTAPAPGILLRKEVGRSANENGPWSSFLPVGVGDDIYYRFVVENTGDVALNTVSVADAPLAAGLTMANCSWKDGDGDSLVAPFTLPYPGQNDTPPTNFYNDHIAVCVLGPLTAVAGLHANTATATGSFGATPYTDEDTATYATAALTLAKSATESYFTAVDDVIHYSFTVTNSGFAPLSGPVVIADNKTSNEACPALSTVGDLDNQFDPGETIVCTATRTVVANPDIADKQIVNTATAEAGAAGSVKTTSNADSVTVLLAPDLGASKFNSTGGEITAGGSFTWTVTMYNDPVAGNAIFAAGTTLLLDNLPDTGATYPGSTLKLSGVTGPLDCEIAGNDLTCEADGGQVVIPASLSGTVAVTNGSATVTGTDTSFGTELSVGSIVLLFDGSDYVPYTVQAISGNELTLDRNYAGPDAAGLQIPGSFSVLVTVDTVQSGALTYPLDLENPRNPGGGGKCQADPDDLLPEMPANDNNCSDLVVSKVMPVLSVIKRVAPYSDPINGTSDPRAIPGSFMTYRLEVQNSGLGSVDAGTTVITDKIPDNAELFVGDLGGTPAGPVSFIDGDACVSGTSPSGLSYSFTALDNTVDSLKFSKSDGSTYDDPTDLPAADGNECDPAVTHFKVELSGPFMGTLVSADNKTTSFCLEYRVRLE